MFLLKKALTPFFLPPGIFIVVLLAAGIWLFRRKHLKAGLLNILIALVMWGLSVAPVGSALVGSLESGLRVPDQPAGDVIVLLGGGIDSDVADPTGKGVPASAALYRLVAAAKLYRRLPVPVIVSGGAVYEGKGREAPVLKRFLVDLGVPEERIILEERSRDTRENAKYVGEICAMKGFRKPLLVTSGFHMKRALLSFAKAGVTAMPVPAGLIVRKGRAWTWDDFLPRAASLEESSAALHEYGGILFYRLFY
jgi:uncharacterized SAM-binding protein YcdF (DUF218 family)